MTADVIKKSKIDEHKMNSREVIAPIAFTFSFEYASMFTSYENQKKILLTCNFIVIINLVITNQYIYQLSIRSMIINYYNL